MQLKIGDASLFPKQRRERVAELHRIARNLGADNQWPRAVAALESAVTLAPTMVALHVDLARARQRIGRLQAAIQAWKHALKLAGDDAAIWRSFTASTRNFVFRAPDKELEKIYLRGLERNDTNHGHYAIPAGSLVAARKPIKALLGSLSDIDSGIKLRTLLHNEEWLSEIVVPLLLSLLEKAPLRDVELERMVTAIRRTALALHREERRLPPSSLLRRALLAIARQGWLNEYLFHEGADETAYIGMLMGERCRGENGISEAERLLLLTCYRAPTEIVGYVEVRSSVGQTREIGADIVGFIDAVHAEHAEESRLAETLITEPIQGSEITQRVKQQYEENPYPRWTSVDQIRPQPAERLLIGVGADPDDVRFRFSSPEVLIAGCGTGLQLLLAPGRYANARLTGIDISRRSLAYAARKLREYGQAETRLFQADLLALPANLGQFDIIECFGVLHHLADPRLGWRNLIQTLAPGGYMMVGLYSRIGRREIIQARDFIRERRFSSKPDGIRRLRQEILSLPKGHPLQRIVRPDSDFWTISDCRDLLFHEHEQQYTLPEIGAMAAELGLTFVGFEFDGPGFREHYRSVFPDDWDAKNLDNWQQLETQNPSLFRGCYRLWFKGE